MADLSPGESGFPLSVVLPTIYRKDLIRSTLSSIVPQLESGDELLISLNVAPQEFESSRAELSAFVASLQITDAAVTRFVTPGRKCKVYQHWNFAISSAEHKEIVFIHDDEIYRNNLLSIARKEFGDDEDTVLVIGGQINVHTFARKFHTFRRVWFTERKIFERGDWLAHQASSTYPKFGATCYMFRRKVDNFWFFEQNIRVADAILMYFLSLRGKVIERTELFGTHLQHAGNTYLRDCLEVDHVPYWLGLQKLGELENVPELTVAAEEVKRNAVSAYSRNALGAALPISDKAGWKECIRQCGLAGRYPSLMVRLIDLVPMKWAILPKIAICIRWFNRKILGNREIVNFGAEKVDLKKQLVVTDLLYQEFKTRAFSNSR